MVPVKYKGQSLTQSLRLDLLVDHKVIVEVKATNIHNPIFEAQALTYLRLMGLRCTGLVSTAKMDVDFFGVKKGKSENDCKDEVKTDKDGWEIWPEAEFEDEAARERQEDMEAMESLSQEYEESRNIGIGAANTEPEEQFWGCPVCGRPQSADERSFNLHIDACLSRKTIADVVKEQKETTPRWKSQQSLVASKKRGRPKTNNNTQRNVRQKNPFFS